MKIAIQALICMTLLFANSITSSTSHGSDEHHGNSTSITTIDHQTHDGVHLASWRWNEFGTIIIFLTMIVFAGILKIVFHHIKWLSHNLPESCVLIVVGIVVGFFIYLGPEEQSEHFPQFTSSLFFNVLLPPIILDSAYTIYDRDFLSNLGSIVLYATIGTLFNVFAIGFLLFGIYQIGWMGTFSSPLDPISCLIFSSLISAVDPVAVLAIFEEIGVNMGLYFIVFGESLFNDGVTVVLYNTMISLSKLTEITPDQYLLAFFSFFTVVLGGLTIGITFGIISALILKHTESTRVIEPLIVFATAYFSFILAETVHWSGIISLIACGIAQKRYAFPNISKKSYTTVKYSVKTLASFSDCIIFLFLGIVTFKHELEWHTGFVLWTVALCLIVRFIVVFFLSWLTNKRRIKPISFREQFIMAYGGLRGAVGFSLVTILDEGSFKNIFLTTTLVMIFFTVFIQGGTIKFLVGKLKISKKGAKVKLISKDINEKTIDHVMAGVEAITGKNSRYVLLEKLRRFDERFTKKALIRRNAENILALRFERITLDEHYARLYGPTVMIHDNQQKAASEGRPSSQPSDSGKLNENEHKLLEKAIANTPFQRYRNRTYRQNSDDRLLKELASEQEESRRKLRETFRKQKRQRAIPEMDEDNYNEDDQTLNEHAQNEISEDSGSDSEGEEKSKLLWKKGFDMSLVKKRYQEAKGEFKNSKSQPPSRHISVTTPVSPYSDTHLDTVL